MNGDFSRLTFDPQKQYSRVLMQQGRALLDADWNEQAAILNHALRVFIRDLVGPHWGVADGEMSGGSNTGAQPADGPARALNSFFILGNDQKYDFSISAGHYYVDGILCENSQTMNYTGQSSYFQKGAPAGLSQGLCVVYLDVWERSISYLEDNDMREVALGDNGPDTAVRARVVWQVKVPPAPILSQLQGDLNGLAGKVGVDRIQAIEDLTNKL